MQFISFIAASMAMVATVTAAPAKNTAPAVVNLIAVTGTDIRTQKFTDVSVEFGKLTYVDHLSITELRIKDVSVSRSDIPKPNVDNVVCQRYLNEFGTVTGSDRFTKRKPALIDTNEIPFNRVLCYVIKN